MSLTQVFTLMLVWRLARATYPALDGEGARRAGGRWNMPGTPMVYTAAHLSLAALELLVHVNPDRLPDDLVAYGIEIPDRLTRKEVKADELSEGWNRRAEVPALRGIGETWAQGREAAALSVPSAVIPEERNYLINPRHTDAAKVQVAHQRPFAFDSRLFGNR